MGRLGLSQNQRRHPPRPGIELTFEATAPVGDIEAIDMGDQLFPHLHGGIPAKGVVVEELPVRRRKDGTFVEIPGLMHEDRLSNNNNRSLQKAGGTVSFCATLGLGIAIGVTLAKVIGSRALAKVFDYGAK